LEATHVIVSNLIELITTDQLDHLGEGSAERPHLFLKMIVRVAGHEFAGEMENFGLFIQLNVFPQEISPPELNEEGGVLSRRDEGILVAHQAILILEFILDVAAGIPNPA
jgi:hypothetical protein